MAHLPGEDLCIQEISGGGNILLRQDQGLFKACQLAISLDIEDEGDFLLVRKRVSTLYATSLSVGLLMLAVILPFTGGFLRLAGTPAELITVGR